MRSDHTGSGGDQMGAAPDGAGLSQVEPLRVSPANAASIPSALVEFFASDLQKGMEARRRAEPGSREVCDAWDNIAAIMVSHMGNPDGPQFGDYVVAALRASASGGEAASAAEPGTGSVHEHPVPAGQAPDELSFLRGEIERLRTALAESERKRAGALGLKQRPPEGVGFEISYVAHDGSTHHSVRSAVEHNESIARTQAATNLLAAGASIWEAARAWSPFPDPKLPEVLKLITKDTPLIISHWQCRDEPGYKVCRFEDDGYYIFVGGDAGSWSGSYGSRVTILDLARYAEETLRKHPNLATPTQETPDAQG